MTDFSRTFPTSHKCLVGDETMLASGRLLFAVSADTIAIASRVTASDGR
jgi:hypothetical protein